MISKFMKDRDALHGHFRSLMPKAAENFDALIRFTYADGALSARTKELIALGVSVAVRCEPCMRYHLEKARARGASDEEMLEAMGVGFEMAAGAVVPPLRAVLSEWFPSAVGQA